MDLLRNIDPSLVPYLVVACGLLCGIIFIVGFIMQVVGGFFDVILGFFEVFLEILQGGPIAWCGCLFLVLGCIGCSGFVFLLLNARSSCEVYPTNFCVWFGFG